MKKTAVDKWALDITCINKVISLGYNVKIIWERDYKINSEKIIQDCMEFLNG